MRRLKPTHLLSATSAGEISCSGDGDCPEGATCNDDGVCVDDYGTPVSGETDVVGGDAGDAVPVRFHVEGINLQRGAFGAEVNRSPAMVALTPVAQDLTEGDTISLESIAESNEDYSALEAQAIVEVYGRGARPQKVIIRTEDV